MDYSRSSIYPEKKPATNILHSSSGDVTVECMSMPQQKEEMRMHVSIQTFMSTIPTGSDHVLDYNLHVQKREL